MAKKQTPMSAAAIALIVFGVVLIVAWVIAWSVLSAQQRDRAKKLGQTARNGAALNVLRNGAATTAPNTKNIAAATAGTTNKEIVFVFAPWCGACHSFRPLWDQWTKSGKAPFRTREVDGSENGAFMDEHKLGFFPSIIILEAGKRVALYEGSLSSVEHFDAWAKQQASS